jgi:hypothetical protein
MAILFIALLTPRSGTIEDVERSIIKEFRYQSEFELGEDAYAVVTKFLTVSAHI